MKFPVLLDRDAGEGGDHERNEVPDDHEAEGPLDDESKFMCDEDAVVKKKDGVLGEQDGRDVKDIGDVDGLGYTGSASIGSDSRVTLKGKSYLEEVLESFEANGEHMSTHSVSI